MAETVRISQIPDQIENDIERVGMAIVYFLSLPKMSLLSFPYAFSGNPGSVQERGSILYC